MRINVVFPVLALLALFAHHATSTNSEPITIATSTPIITTSLDETLCLDLDSITLTDIEWSSGSDSKWAQTKGIFYVYSKDGDSSGSYKFTEFPIYQHQVDINQSLPTIFAFEGEEQTIGCWTKPTFKSLKVRFKIYQYYHTALKAE
eukprot:315082_1